MSTVATIDHILCITEKQKKYNVFNLLLKPTTMCKLWIDCHVGWFSQLVLGTEHPHKVWKILKSHSGYRTSTKKSVKNIQIWIDIFSVFSQPCYFWKKKKKNIKPIKII